MVARVIKKVSRSFVEVTRTKFIAYFKFPGNHRIGSLYLYRKRLISLEKKKKSSVALFVSKMLSLSEVLMFKNS